MPNTYLPKRNTISSKLFVGKNISSVKNIRHQDKNSSLFTDEFFTDKVIDFGYRKSGKKWEPEEKHGRILVRIYTFLILRDITNKSALEFILHALQ